MEYSTNKESNIESSELLLSTCLVASTIEALQEKYFGSEVYRFIQITNQLRKKIIYDMDDELYNEYTATALDSFHVDSHHIYDRVAALCNNTVSDSLLQTDGYRVSSISAGFLELKKESRGYREQYIEYVSVLEIDGLLFHKRSMETMKGGILVNILPGIVDKRQEATLNACVRQLPFAQVELENLMQYGDQEFKDIVDNALAQT